MKPEDKLPLRLRIRAEWSQFVNWILRPTNIKRVADCRLCGRKGFSTDWQDPDNIINHVIEYHPEQI